MTHGYSTNETNIGARPSCNAQRRTDRDDGTADASSEILRRTVDQVRRNYTKLRRLLRGAGRREEYARRAVDRAFRDVARGLSELGESNATPAPASTRVPGVPPTDAPYWHVKRDMAS
ncbi:hypothetical protein SAMN04488094_10749 [Tropicimonas isoalkanivorans]|uniref:Uncharacterized protein n=1 Tax=Tropicimonas isoalkanivorans TaxID=441112 RepID=A0A1I1KQY9_9RHOB|nr:hypothetical protein SAMN04488094_10749 [Tropicimonas isoalkanivorans]